MTGAGFTANLLKRFYLRERRDAVEADVLGFRMKLEPAECIDGGLLFYPHLYEHHEIAFLKRNLRSGDVFLDIGANIGFYSLIASPIVGNQGMVLAIEADPYNYQKLIMNLKVNNIENVQALNVGVSDKEEILRLGLNVTGNRGGNSFLSTSKHGIHVNCHPLSALLKNNHIEKIGGAKFDIEGFEFRVLDGFFNDADHSLYPNFIIIEQNPEFKEKAGGNAIDLLMGKGYHIERAGKLNCIMALSK
jgi:FkbM family methyltransferase